MHNVLLILQLNVNIFSGIKHYAVGGSLGYDRLYGNNRKPFALLNFMQSRFFLTLKGYPIPRTDHTHFSYYSSSYWITESAPGTTTHAATNSPGIAKSATDHPGIAAHAATDRPGIDKLLTDHPGIAAPMATNGPGIIELSTDHPGPNTHAAANSPGIATHLATDRYQKLLAKALLWHRRLGHPGLLLLKKTARITEGVPNMDSIKEADFRCKSCDLAKAVRRPNNKPIEDPDRVLDRLEGDTFKISPIPHNRRRIGLIIVDRKSRYRWLILLKSREAIEVVCDDR